MPDHVTAVLAGVINRSLQEAMKSRKVYTENLDEQSVRNGTVQGFVELDGAGEALVDITWPLTFLEKPVFAPGLELADNNWLEDGNFPLWSATVVRWNAPMLSGYPSYRGALLGIVVFATPDTQSILHFTFEAQSYTSPTGLAQSLTGTL
jgi:hypothetical protein